MANETKSTAERLGYAADARVLILNADDFGMCHDQNEGVMRGLKEGVFTSSTILVTCPWFEEAADFARNNPDADLGVHLTLTAEWDAYKWGPVLGAAAVPSLVDERGYLWQTVAQVYEHARLDEAEAELRAQIEKALAAGIDVTHLDSHMGTLQLRADYHEIYARLANEYRLPIRLASRRRMRTEGMGAILDQLDAARRRHARPSRIQRAGEGQRDRIVLDQSPSHAEAGRHRDFVSSRDRARRAQELRARRNPARSRLPLLHRRTRRASCSPMKASSWSASANCAT